MPYFEYFKQIVDSDLLQSLLTDMGAEGWRLHTCEPILPAGLAGSGTLRILVVMDRVVHPPEKDASTGLSDADGMRMGG